MTASSARSARAGPCEPWSNATLPCFTPSTRTTARSTSGSGPRSNSCAPATSASRPAGITSTAGSTRSPTGTGRCGGAVEGWAADIDAGRDAALFAYQRSNVAELNRLAREVMVDSGRVSGPEVHGLAVGDRVISTAPIPDVGMVNSQRATVIAVNEAWQMIDLRADDGRLLAGDPGRRAGPTRPRLCHHRSPFAGRHGRHRACAGRRRRPRTGLCGHVQGPRGHPHLHHRRRHRRGRRGPHGRLAAGAPTPVGDRHRPTSHRRRSGSTSRT